VRTACLSGVDFPVTHRAESDPLFVAAPTTTKRTVSVEKRRISSF
jgi:hypothetical protein